MWKDIRRDIDLDPEIELAENVYLGCNQREVRPELQWLNDKNDLFKKLTTHAIAEGDLCKKTKSSQDKGQKKKDGKLDATDTSIAGGDSSLSRESYPAANIATTRAWNYDMIGHAEQCVIRWCELAHKELKDIPTVGTPCIDDHNLRPEDFVEQGALPHVCARIVMKCLYLARIGRPDILYTINVLARSVTK